MSLEQLILGQLQKGSCESGEPYMDLPSLVKNPLAGPLEAPRGLEWRFDALNTTPPPLKLHQGWSKDKKASWLSLDFVTFCVSIWSLYVYIYILFRHKVQLLIMRATSLYKFLEGTRGQRRPGAATTSTSLALQRLPLTATRSTTTGRLGCGPCR